MINWRKYKDFGMCLHARITKIKYLKTNQTKNQKKKPQKNPKKTKKQNKQQQGVIKSFSVKNRDIRMSPSKLKSMSPKDYMFL